MADEGDAAMACKDRVDGTGDGFKRAEFLDECGVGRGWPQKAADLGRTAMHHTPAAVVSAEDGEVRQPGHPFACVGIHRALGMGVPCSGQYIA